MKHLLPLLALIPSLLFAQTSQTSWSDMAITSWYNPSESQFIITTPGQLAGLAELVNNGNDFSGKTIVLGANIVLNDTTENGGWHNWNEDNPPTNTWVAIGNSSNQFQGTFDGGGYVVSGVYKDTTTIGQGSYTVNNQGLFGIVGSDGTIKNLGVKAFYVHGWYYVGGLVGINNGGTITNSYATGNVVGGYTNIGGLVGLNENGTITNSYATGDVSGATSRVGGLVGINNGGTITNSYATGNVSGTETSTSNYVGGLVGYNGNSSYSGTITNSYATGNVNGTTYVGGLAGYTESGTISISNSYATGNVVGTGYVGGLVGINFGGTISNSYATGNVSGNEGVGGLAGQNNVTITNSYATGNVSGNSDVGGLAGKNFGTITNSYYDSETSGQADNGYGTPKETHYMKSEEFVRILQCGASILSANEWIYNQNSYPTLGNTIASTASLFAGGNGTQGSPYIIKTKEQLESFSFLVNLGKLFDGEFIKLNNDIALNDTTDWESWNETNKPTNTWVAIGNGSNISFRGTFDGGGHVVSGVYINSASANQGLFGYVYPNSSNDIIIIKNLGVKAFYVKGSGNVGGLVGYNRNSTISNSYATGSVEGTGDYVGGLVGNNAYSSTISDSYATGSVEGTGDYVGGLVGNNEYSSTISDSYATGNVVGTTNLVGGLVGNNRGTISNSYATGNVSGTTNLVGGLVGNNRGTISNSYATGNVSGNDHVGGLMGDNYNGITINSYATGDVSGNDYVGGLAGLSYGSITNSYATGDVSGTGTYVGGLAGLSYGSITNSYATGDVSGTGTYVGGLVGNASSNSITNSYYDSQTSKQNDTGKGDGRSTADMKNKNTYIGWDFEEVWGIGTVFNGGMPYLITGTFQEIDNALKKDYEEGLTLVNVILPAGYQWATPNTPLSAGTWQFEAIHTTTTGRKEISKGNVSVNVAKATPPYTVPSLTATYGQTLENVTLPSNWSWMNTATSVGNAGERTHSAKFTPADTDNYNTIENINVTVNVLKATPTVPPPPPGLIAIYGDLLSDVDLPPGWSWEGTGTVGDVGVQTHKATFNPDPSNYNSVAGLITITVAKTTPPFPSINPISTAYEEGLKLGSISLTGGCSWVEPNLPLYPGNSQQFEAVYALNHTHPIAGTVTVNVSKNPGPEPEFPAISVNATFKENLTLANIALPNGYAWAVPSAKITSPDDGQQFDATHANSYYAQPSAGKITVNASSGAGVVAIDGWSYGEKPGTPLTETITNGAATLLYTGKTNGGTTYSNTRPPTEAGRYTLTATFAAKGGSGEIIRTAQFTIERAEGIGAVRIDGWKSGSKASDPLSESETNGTENVSYIYRSTDGTSHAPQPSKPSNAGNYMLIAVFPETNNYTEARDTTYFTISKPDAIELTVVWSDNGVFTYNKMAPHPVPTAKHNETDIPLIVLKTRSDAGEYKGVTEAIAMIADENLRTDYILKNNSKSYTVEKKALVPRFTVKNPIDEFDAKEDTIWVPRSIFSNPALLSSILAELIDYEGFARDTVKNESDNASVLSGVPRVEVVYENPVSSSALYRRVETTRKATAIIVTDDVSAKNYELIKTNVTIVETLEEEDGTQQVSCSVNSSCAPMSGNSCSAIGGEAFASCTMRCSVGNACAPMPVGSCAIMEGEIVDICPGEEIEPVRRPVLSGGSLRIWQTASGVVNVDLGYTPSAPVALRVYSIKGKLVATERVSTRFASVAVKVPSGVYLFRAGNRVLRAAVL